MSSSVIEYVGDVQEKSPLIVLRLNGHSFPEGLNPKYGVYKNKSNNSAMVCVEAGDDIFRGRIETEEESHTQLLLAVRNKHTNKMRLLPLKSCVLKKVPKFDNETVEEIRPGDINVLSETFGSKRMKRYVQSSSKVDINLEDSQKKISKIVSGVEVDMEDLNEVDNLGEEIVNVILPPCNRNAEKPEDVYDLNDIVTEKERQNLESSAVFLLDNPPKPTDSSGPFFLYSHYNILKENMTTEKMEVLLYLDSIVKLLQFKYRKLNLQGNAATICPYSKYVGKKIIKKFTDASLKMTDVLMDKAICFVFIGLLIISDFKLHMDVLTTCFKGFKVTKLNQLCRLVGAKPEFKLKKDCYTLKLPLTKVNTIKKSKKQKIRV